MCRIIFAKNDVFFSRNRNDDIDYQALKKEALPAWVRPPFLQCKDNTFKSEMQIVIFSDNRDVGEKLLHSACHV